MSWRLVRCRGAGCAAVLLSRPALLHFDQGSVNSLAIDLAMACFTCNFCRVQRPVNTRSWMRSQVASITQNDSPVVGNYNACRQCSPSCWVDPPLPEGGPPPNICIICREVRAVNRQHWMPSQMKSIWALRTSVTTNHNCCRSCDPSCWVFIFGKRIWLRK